MNKIALLIISHSNTCSSFKSVSFFSLSKSISKNISKNTEQPLCIEVQEEVDTTNITERDVLEVYELNFLNGIVFMCAGLTMVFYSLWSISQKANLVYTVPIVLFIVIRYLLLVFAGKAEADPTTLILSDKTLLISCGICGIIMLIMPLAVPIRWEGIFT